MSLSILTNLPSIKAQRHLNDGHQSFSRASEQLATGKRINRLGDDAAGLAIATGLQARIRSMGRAERNAQDAQALIQVAGGGINEISNLIVRLRELAIQAASDTVSDDEREMINIEAQESIQEVERIANVTEFLGTPLLNGEGSEFVFQVGADATEFDRLSYEADSVDVRATSLGVDGLDLGDRDSALDALETIDDSIKALHLPLAQLGAVQNRLDSTISYTRVFREALIDAEARITDADFAKASAAMTLGQIQQQAAIGVLAQANQQPAVALKLL